MSGDRKTNYATTERRRSKVKTDNYLVPVVEALFVIPAPHRVRDKLQRESSFFAIDPCFRRGDIVDIRFPQQ